MSNQQRGEVFADFDPARALWVRNKASAGEPKPVWHIYGPRMPRVANVSPSHVSPCGMITWSDHSETTRPGGGAPANGEACGFCTRWLEALGWG